ncbi:MAG: hypothetical protein ABIA93_03550 [Candidatus Woesearchaeota archaeon]
MASKDYETFGTRVIPRDMGIVLQTKADERLFISPSRLALASVMADTPEEVRGRIERLAQNIGEDSDALEARITKGVIRRAGSSRMLTKSPRYLMQVESLGNSIVGHTISKGSKKVYRVSMSASNGELTYVSCRCPDNEWSDVKGVKYELCMHASLLYEALRRDNSSRQSTGENRTGLSPQDRFAVSLPLSLNSDQVASALLAYANRTKLFDISREILDESVTPASLDAVLREGRARIGVMRQDRAEPQNSEYLGSLRRLEESLRSRIRQKGFRFEGYSLEFPESEHETVGIRFERGDQRYVLCLWDDKPPVLVAKSLREYDGGTAVDKGDSPYRRMVWRDALDHSTRRVSIEQVIVPGFRENGQGTRISQVLRAAYKPLLT